MKLTKLITSVALLYLLSFAYLAQAQERVTIQSDLGSGVIKLLYKAAETGTVKVTILNSKGETIFTESLVKVSTFARPYNISEQGVGDFKVIVEDKDGKTEKTVSFSPKKVESTIDVSKIANATNKYLLSIENKDSDQIEVKIMDASKNVLHEETLTVNGKFSVIYNLTKFKTTPTFEVTGSNGVTKTFNF